MKIGLRPLPAPLGDLGEARGGEEITTRVGVWGRSP
jgi:hypothetical protein